MKLTLRSYEQVATDARSFFFVPETPVSWKAGQFITYELPHDPVDDRGTKRWFTIASAPHEEFIQITTRLSAPGSSFKQALISLEPGDTIEGTIPEGDFTVKDPKQQHVFIAGGIGITPFRSILLDLHHRNEPLNATVLYANKRPETTVFMNDLDDLDTQHPEMDLHYFFEPIKLTESLIRDYVPALSDPIFYVSGPEPMVESLGETLLAMGVPKNHITQDFFPNYTNI